MIPAFPSLAVQRSCHQDSSNLLLFIASLFKIVRFPAAFLWVKYQGFRMSRAANHLLALASSLSLRVAFPPALIYIWFHRKRSHQGRFQPLTPQSPEIWSWAHALQEQLHGCPQPTSLSSLPPWFLRTLMFCAHWLSWRMGSKAMNVTWQCILLP